MIIVISGLTAAGKTTHGRILADALHVPFVEASEVFRSLAGNALNGVRWLGRWTPELDTLRAATDLDSQVDATLIRSIDRASSGVYDAALLPWLTNRRDLVRIWMESDEPSRVRKCVVSHFGDCPELTLDSAQAIVAGKDKVTRERLFSVARRVMKPDREFFDAVVDNSSLIPQATSEAARAGILRFSLELERLVDHLRNPGAVSPPGPPLVPWVRT